MKHGKLSNTAFLVIGIIIGMFGVTTATSVVAAVNSIQATVTYRDIKVNIDGKPTVLTDLDGQPIEPVILFDRVYVPLSGIGRAFNRNVTWDSATSTVHIRRKDDTSTVGLKPVKLTNLTYTKQGGHEFVYSEGMLDNTNNYVEDCWLLSSNYTHDRTSRNYDINREYARIEGTMFIPLDRQNMNTTYKLEIYCDDKLAYESPYLSSGGNPIKFDVGIDNVKDLRVQFVKVNGESHGSYNVAISNVTLYKYSYDE
jgi:hypothetical protein